jgi:hypothetical protein
MRWSLSAPAIRLSTPLVMSVGSCGGHVSTCEGLVSAWGGLVNARGLPCQCLWRVRQQLWRLGQRLDGVAHYTHLHCRRLDPPRQRVDWLRKRAQPRLRCVRRAAYVERR